MTKYIIFDTETSGLFNFKLPADDPTQPRLAQFGAITIDHIGAEPNRVGMYIRPNGWVMEPGASAANGLTTEFLHANGRPIDDALNFYSSLIRAGYVAVAYHAQFDCKMMRAEFRRANRDDLFSITKNICLMRACTKIGITKAGNARGWPKLSDACAHFGIAQSKAHDALGDAEDAYRLFLKMLPLGVLPEPAVHFAKELA